LNGHLKNAKIQYNKKHETKTLKNAILKLFIPRLVATFRSWIRRETTVNCTE